MEIIGIDERESTMFVKISKSEFAQFAGFSSHYSMTEKVTVTVGECIDVGQCWSDAQEALELHETALKAAQQLKASSTRFLSFFKIKENQ